MVNIWIYLLKQNLLNPHVLYFSDCDVLEHKYLKLVSSAYAPGTVANFKSQWRTYIKFCVANRLQLFPPVQLNLVKFYTTLIESLTAYSSLQNYESSINMFYRLYGYHMDNTSILTKVLNLAAKKCLTTVPAAKVPLEVSHVIRFSQVCDMDNPFEVTWLSALQVAFMALLRKSNVCPPSVPAFDSKKHLLRSDIKLEDSGISVNLRWSKTNQTVDKVLNIPVAHSNDSQFDPPAFYKQFAERFPVLPGDPCFSFYYHNKHFVLTQRDLSAMLQVFLARIGVSSHGITSHSIRKGGANLLMRAGVSIPSLQHHGTWASDAYKQYLCFNKSDKLQVTKKVYAYLQKM